MTPGAGHCLPARRLFYRIALPRTAPGRCVSVARRHHCSPPPGALARFLRGSVLALLRPTTPSDTVARTGQFQRKMFLDLEAGLGPFAEYAAGPRGSIAHARAD